MPASNTEHPPRYNKYYLPHVILAVPRRSGSAHRVSAPGVATALATKGGGDFDFCDGDRDSRAVHTGGLAPGRVGLRRCHWLNGRNSRTLNRHGGSFYVRFWRKADIRPGSAKCPTTEDCWSICWYPARLTGNSHAHPKACTLKWVLTSPPTISSSFFLIAFFLRAFVAAGAFGLVTACMLDVIFAIGFFGPSNEDPASDEGH